MKSNTPPHKPLKQKAYGSIPHLPGSRRGPGDKGLSVDQARICTTKARDRHDVIVVQEKLDGSCVAVAKLESRIVPLIRAGYEAANSNYPQHHLFAAWVFERWDLFAAILQEGEWLVGEWLAQAHGTRYALPHDPFVAFDLMRGSEHARERTPIDDFTARIADRLPIPRLIHRGGPLTIDAVLEILEPSGHGALDPVEGAVWRVERKGVVDFLGKYVRPDKTDGCYLPEIANCEPYWNWRPEQTK